MALIFWSSYVMGTISPPVAGTRRFPGKLYLALGICLVFLGPVLYMVQIWARILRAPWYAPALATAGVALLLLAVLRKVTVWRIAALALCIALAGLEWHFLVSLSKLRSEERR